jgi:CBS domain-containing protein
MVEPEPKAVMQSSIFFDMRPVAGHLDLAHSLHAEVLEEARESTLFRRFLAAESMGNRPALGLFGQFAREDGDGAARGINLKKRGVIPIVDLARVRALEGAIGAVHTEERIRTAAEADIMSPSDADDLIHALRFIGNIRLRHQVALFDAGDQPNHLVDPDELSGLHRRYLRSAFGIVKTAQRALEQRYAV